MAELDPDKETRANAPLPIEAIGTEAVADGTVKFWREEKGHGAIACAQTAPFDIWCHFSAIEMAGFRALNAGQQVIVEYVRADQDTFKYRATRVRLKR